MQVLPVDRRARIWLCPLASCALRIARDQIKKHRTAGQDVLRTKGEQHLPQHHADGWMRCSGLCCGAAESLPQPLAAGWQASQSARMLTNVLCAGCPGAEPCH